MAGILTPFGSLFLNPAGTWPEEAMPILFAGSAIAATDRSIDVSVGRLRRKIEDNPSKPIYLHTIWGSGYLFTLEEQ